MNFTPLLWAAGLAPSVTVSADAAGMKTVAVVFAGIVTFKVNLPPARCQSLVIFPRIES